MPIVNDSRLPNVIQIRERLAYLLTDDGHRFHKNRDYIWEISIDISAIEHMF